MWEVYKVLFLLITFFVLCLFFFIVFFFNFNLFWIFFHSFFSLIFILFIIFFLRNSSSKWEAHLFRCDNFFYFFICEILCEIIFVLSYFLEISPLFNFIIIIKLGNIPFFYNFYFLSSLSFNFFISRYIFLAYGFMSKVWMFLLSSIIPTSLDVIWFYVTISCFTVIFFINFKEDNLPIWSILYNDLIYLLILTIFSSGVIFSYIFYSIYFQWKILPIIATQQEVGSGRYLVLFNGSPIFIFNWIKFIIIFTTLISFGIFKMVLLSFISFFILFYSILRIRNSEFHKVFLLNKLSLFFEVVLMIIFVLMTFFSNFINNFFLF